jgi:hypothetical protein
MLKTLALEVKRNEIHFSELFSCNESMSSLKSLNVDLSARIENLSIASSFVKHVSICNRCRYVDIDACNTHASTILKLNNDVANLSPQLKTCKSENDKIKFARDHAYLYALIPHIAKRTMPIYMIMLRMLLVLFIMIMLFYLLVMILPLIHMPCLHPLALRMLMVGIDLGVMLIMLLPMRLGMHLMVQLCFIILMMLHLGLCVKMIELLLEMWGLSAREARFEFGFQSLM